MFFGRKSRPSSVMCFIFIFINSILVVFAEKKILIKSILLILVIV